MYKNPDVLYQEMLPTIKQLSSMYKVKGMERDDLEQEFAIVLLKCNENFDGSKGATFRTFFVASCKNKVKDFWRHKDEILYVLNDPVSDSEHSEVIDLLVSDLLINKRDYLDMLRALPEGYITHKWAYGATFQEIADELNTSVSSVYRAHLNNIKKLRDILGIAEKLGT